jgi:DNA-binding transcriptional regulator YhcF (GntR family)
MESKFTKKCKEEHYTIVYFDVMKDLQIDFREYIVLQTILHFSKKNQYNKGILKLSNHLKVSRNTVYKALNELLKKGHIFSFEPNSKTINLKHDVRERFEMKGKIYVKIYHNHRKELKLSLRQYVLLYMVYSLSKNRKSRIAIAGTKKYCEYINFSESHFATSKSKLIKAKLLEPLKTHFLKLNVDIFNWFENNKSVQE